MVMQLETMLARESAAQTGEEIYDARLKSVLEPKFSGRIVAIHIPSKNYFVGESIIEASKLLRQKHPQAGHGEIYIRGIGIRSVIQAHTPRVKKL